MKNLKITQLRKDLMEVTKESEYKWDIKKVGKELRISNNYLDKGEYFRFYQYQEGLGYTCYMLELFYEHNCYKDKVGTIFIGKDKYLCESEELTYEVMKNVFCKIRIFFDYYM